MYYIFGYYIFCWVVATGNVITENVIIVCQCLNNRKEDSHIPFYVFMNNLISIIFKRWIINIYVAWWSYKKIKFKVSDVQMSNFLCLVWY